MEEKKNDSQRKEVDGPSFVIKSQGVPSLILRRSEVRLRIRLKVCHVLN